MAPSKDNQVPIDFTLLRRPPVDEHYVGPGDVLGVYVEDVLPVDEKLPHVSYPSARDGIEAPLVGHPITVRSDGRLQLPLLPPVDVNDLTIPEAIYKVRAAYLDEGILTDKKTVTIDLIRPRSVEVFVIREDTGPGAESLIRPEQQVIAKRGSADVLDMPIYENDVLHALAATGGLPGIDGYNEIWILRGANLNEEQRSVVVASLEIGSMPSEYLDASRAEVIRIPLRKCPGQAFPLIEPDDVILHDGDVVFIESRQTEYFTTGGHIDGGKFPLPRDYDVDVLEAIAIANTNILGPAGNATATNFRSGPGNIVPPTRAIVVRQLASGEQIKIEVDLKAAMNDPQERINIMSRDVIVLKYKPVELMGNIALNFVNFNYVFPN